MIPPKKTPLPAQDDSGEAFKALSKAYETLADRDARHVYDSEQRIRRLNFFRDVQVSAAAARACTGCPPTQHAPRALSVGVGVGVGMMSARYMHARLRACLHGDGRMAVCCWAAAGGGRGGRCHR